MKQLGAVLLVAVVLGWGESARSHCDTLDGPVVAAAQVALERGDVTPVLKWVKPHDEQAVRDAFAKAIAVRGGGDQARQLADAYFFETLVRLHRAGEGVGYTGLKPAGSVDPGIAAADRALAEGSVDRLASDIGDAVQAGLRRRFAKVLAARQHADDGVDAGRAYVEAYVDYVHYVEALHGLSAAGAGGHQHIHAER